MPSNLIQEKKSVLFNFFQVINCFYFYGQEKYIVPLGFTYFFTFFLKKKIKESIV